MAVSSCHSCYERKRSNDFGHYRLFMEEQVVEALGVNQEFMVPDTFCSHRIPIHSVSERE